MKKILFLSLLIVTVLSAKNPRVDLDNSDFFEAPLMLDWQLAVKFCVDMGARILNIDELEDAYNSNLSENFAPDYYWSGTHSYEDMDGAYAFHFAIGNAVMDYAAKRHRVMCVKKAN